MNLGSLIVGVFMLGCVVVGIVLITANASNTATTDTYGNGYDQTHNSTQNLSDTITNVGIRGAEGGFLVVCAILIIACVGFVGILASKYL